MNHQQVQNLKEYELHDSIPNFTQEFRRASVELQLNQHQSDKLQNYLHVRWAICAHTEVKASILVFWNGVMTVGYRDNTATFNLPITDIVNIDDARLKIAHCSINNIFFIYRHPKTSSSGPKT